MIWQQCSDLNPLSIGYLCWRQVAWSPGALTGHAYYWQKCLQELASQVGFISFSSTFITMINFSYLCTDYVNSLMHDYYCLLASCSSFFFFINYPFALMALPAKSEYLKSCKNQRTISVILKGHVRSSLLIKTWKTKSVPKNVTQQV